MEHSNNDMILRERQKRFFEFIKKKTDWVIYVILAFIVYLAVWIRTRNLPGLKDITTGGWTLGPDLDPFLFLRYSKYIVEHGSFFALDPMRYAPLGFDTGLEYPLLHYSMAWFHKIASIFGSVSVEQSAVIYPVFMFAITVIAFYLMTRESFTQTTGKKNASYIALVASFFLSIIPAFIPRTIAGIPEKESAAFFFFFMAFYLFLLGWHQEKLKKQVMLSFAGGFFAGLMALIWGGFGYILIIISCLFLILFMLGQINLRRIFSYYAFILPVLILPLIFFPRFSISGALRSIDWMFALLTAFILLVDYLLNHKFSRYVPNRLRAYPRITSMIYSGIILSILGVIFFGFDFVFQTLMRFYNIFRPNPSRLIQTVAENREPFFVEWASNFGPSIRNIPILLSIVLFSSIILFYKTFKEFFKNRKNIFIMTGLWAVFFLAIIITRYNSSSLFNGTNFISVTGYILGLLSIFAGFLYFFNRKEFVISGSNLSIGALFALAFLAIGLQSARSSIRVVLILVPPASMFIGYLSVISVRRVIELIKNKDILNFKTFVYSIIIIMILLAGYSHYSNAKSLAQSYVPSPYNQQWQKAMAWVRDNTPVNAVFGHWWDYGYWLQSIGERATVLDGGNLLGYWNYLMGRYGLTETDLSKTLEFLYAHNVTHFLIDSTDIGKYSAFSTIGSDASYDRRSWIPTLLRDNTQTTERKNTTINVYPAGSSLDRDIIYNLNGTDIFLPEGKSYLAATIVTVKKETDLVSEVFGVYFFQDKTYQIPLRYYWDNKTGLVDTGKGINAGVFFYPRVTVNSQGGAEIEPRGAMLYLSPKTVMSNVARFYLYNERNNNFKLVHSEQDSLVDLLKSQGIQVGDFVFFNELRGPIKIWEMNYPDNIVFKEEYLQTEYPEELLLA